MSLRTTVCLKMEGRQTHNKFIGWVTSLTDKIYFYCLLCKLKHCQLNKQFWCDSFRTTFLLTHNDVQQLWIVDYETIYKKYQNNISTVYGKWQCKEESFNMIFLPNFEHNVAKNLIALGTYLYNTSGLCLGFVFFKPCARNRKWAEIDKSELQRKVHLEVVLVVQ